MIITLDIPDNAEGNLAALSAELKMSMEQIVYACLAAGCQVISNASPEVKAKIAEQFQS